MQIKQNIRFDLLNKGDYAFIRIAKGEVEDIGLLYYFDDGEYPLYLTHNPKCGWELLERYAKEYGYKFACGVHRTLYFHTTHLLDTLIVSIKLNSSIGEPREIEILQEIPSKVSNEMMAFIK